MTQAVPKIGLLVFDPGRRLAGHLDLDALLTKLTKARGVSLVARVDAPWSRAGRADIEKALAGGLIDRCLWVGRYTTEQKRKAVEGLAGAGLNPFMHEWCDLEEQGVLGPDLSASVRRSKAEALLKMSLARTRLLEPLSPVEVPAVDAALIVGAGFGGLKAAATLGGLGKKVYLIERCSGVGGKTALLSRFYPLGCDPRCGLVFTLDRLSRAGSVEVHCLSQVKSVTGQPGAFTVTVEKKPRFVSLELCNACGECLKVCPKDQPIRPENLQDVPPVSPEMGLPALLGSTAKAIHPAWPAPWPEALVIDRDLCPPGCRACAEACPAGAIDLDESAGEMTVQAGFILAATGWDPYPLSRLAEYGYGRLPRVIGNLEMEQLLAAGFEGPAPATGFNLSDLKAIGFIQCAGSRDERHLRYCSSVCCSATLKQVKRLREISPAVKAYVFYQDIRTPGFEEDLYREVAGMEGVIFIRGNPSAVAAAEDGQGVRIRAEDTFLQREVNLDLDLLVLAGGMVPAQGSEDLARRLGLPLNRYKFFESHLQCHPEESQRTGLYVGGCAREPMNVARAIESCHRAAMEGLSFLKEMVVVPPTHPVVDLTKCDQCKRCVEECPFQAYSLDEKGFPRLNLTKCRHCGNCMGACPLAAISLRHLTIKQTSAQIESLGESLSFIGREPVVLAFLCENDAYPAARSAVEQGLPWPANVVHLKVPCAGAVNNALIADALSLGVDGVLIAGCEDGQCHYLKGSQLIRKRSGDLADKLKQMVMEPERVRFESLGVRQAGRYVRLIDEYVNQLKELGPNPFKV
ncbi:MAG: hydrogenase iron-sulfur subunit [Thermodesulfobacteriota bacterium]